MQTTKIKNIKQLRESLCDNYEKMKNKTMGLNIGKELANTAGKMINSCKIEMEYNQMMLIKKEIEFLNVDDDK